jgi:hypothetical protein
MLSNSLNYDFSGAVKKIVMECDGRCIETYFYPNDVYHNFIKANFASLFDIPSLCPVIW